MPGCKHSYGRTLGEELNRPARSEHDSTLRRLPLADCPTLAVPRVPSAETIASAPTLPAFANGDDTIATPLQFADTLPCPRLAADEAPTLRTSPTELAALLRLMRTPGMPPPLPSAVPVRASDSSVRVPESGRTWQTRPPYAPQPSRGVAAGGRDRITAVAAERDAMMPTQLWFGSPAGALRMQARPTRPGSFWVRLWRRLGLTALLAPRRKALPRSHRRRR